MKNNEFISNRTRVLKGIRNTSLIVAGVSTIGYIITKRNEEALLIDGDEDTSIIDTASDVISDITSTSGNEITTDSIL